MKRVFVRKLDLWLKNMKSKCYEMAELLTSFGSETSEEFAQEIVRHLSLSKSELRNYFLDMTWCIYILNSFAVDPAELTGKQKDLIDIQADMTAKTKRKKMLSCKPLAQHGLLVPVDSPSRCSPATDYVRV